MWSFSFSVEPSSGRCVLQSINGEEIRLTMKATPVPTAVTIKTAATERGTRCRSR